MDNRKNMEKTVILKIIEKLNGKINPVGETNTDNERFENLENLCSMISTLLEKVEDVANENKDSYEFSRKRAFEYASNFLNNI